MSHNSADPLPLFHRRDPTRLKRSSTRGFGTGHSTYLTGEMHSGVFLADVPVSSHEGATEEDLLTVVVNDALISEFEFIDMNGMWDLLREWCAPAEELNNLTVRLLSPEESRRQSARRTRKSVAPPDALLSGWLPSA